MSDFLSLILDFVVAATADDDKYIPLPPGTWEIESVVLAPNATSTGHASNFADLNIYEDDGTTVLYNRDTDSGGDGTLTAATEEALTKESGGDVRFVSTAASPVGIRVNKTESGTGVAIDCTFGIFVRRVAEL